MTKQLLELPRYLQSKLAAIQINSHEQIMTLGSLEIFARLKFIYPSLSFQALFDLNSLSTLNPVLDASAKKSLIQAYRKLTPRYPPLAEQTINDYLSAAEEQAQLAAEQNEVPIGAVIVYQDQIIARGFNQTRAKNTVLGHAEILAIEQAQGYLANYRLSDCDLYVTIEPCLMCSGAIINSRIRRLIFGATEPKTGACCSQYRVFANPATNHHTQIIGPLDQTRYGLLLSQFFHGK